MRTTDLTELRYSVAGGVATVMLHRPERLNAFTLTMADELATVAAAADADDDVRVVVVTGAGRAFCAGADLGGGPDTFGDRRTRPRPPGVLSQDIGGFPRDAGGVAALPFAALRKPVIAAVNGPAVGIGATLTLPMDIRIAGNRPASGSPSAASGSFRRRRRRGSCRAWSASARRWSGWPPDGSSTRPRPCAVAWSRGWCRTTNS